MVYTPAHTEVNSKLAVNCNRSKMYFRKQPQSGRQDYLMTYTYFTKRVTCQAN